MMNVNRKTIKKAKLEILSNYYKDKNYKEKIKEEAKELIKKFEKKV